MGTKFGQKFWIDILEKCKVFFLDPFKTGKPTILYIDENSNNDFEILQTAEIMYILVKLFAPFKGTE
jgi:hypothetical protein